MFPLIVVDGDGYEIREEGERLRIELRKDLDTHRNVDRWAVPITKACRGPYAEVAVDCSGHVTLSSTIIAGLVHLADHFSREGAQLVLEGAGERIQRTMQMMHLDSLFSFAGR